MIPKPGKDPKKATSYRPISLISCLGKIYERYVCEYLINILSENKIVNRVSDELRVENFFFSSFCFCFF